MILLLSGKKQSGKSTSCYRILNKIQEAKFGEIKYFISNDGTVSCSNPEFNQLNVETHKSYLEDMFKEIGCKLYSFADPIKKFCIETLNLDPIWVYGTNDDKSTQTHIYWDALPEDLQVMYRRPGVKMSRKQAMTARQVMEVIGDLFRQMDENCWCHSTYKLIEKEQYPISIISDGRYPNEVAMCSEYGGTTVRLQRDAFPNETKSRPEKALDDFPLGNFDYVIDNDNMTIEEKDLEIDKIIRDKVKI